MDFGVLYESRWFLLRALLVTVELSLCSAVLAFGLGILLAVGRLYGGRPLSLVLTFVIDSLRAIPVLVVLIWMFFVFPLLTGIALDTFTTAVLGLGIHLAAYVAESVRGGIVSVRQGQWRAALALGMAPYQALTRIILPQALIRILPNLASLLTFAIKDSAVASVIAVGELVRQSQVLAGATFHPFEVFTGALVAYFVLCWPIGLFANMIYRRIAHRGAS